MKTCNRMLTEYEEAQQRVEEIKQRLEKAKQALAEHEAEYPELAPAERTYIGNNSGRRLH